MISSLATPSSCKSPLLLYGYRHWKGLKQGIHVYLPCQCEWKMARMGTGILVGAWTRVGKGGWKQSHPPMNQEEQNKQISELCLAKVSSDCMSPTTTTVTKNHQTKDTKQTIRRGSKKNKHHIQNKQHHMDVDKQANKKNNMTRPGRWHCAAGDKNQYAMDIHTSVQEKGQEIAIE